MLATNELDSEEKPSYCMTFQSDTDIFQRLASSFTASSSLRMLSLSMVVRRCTDERCISDIPVTVQLQPGTALPTVVDFGRLQDLKLPCPRTLRFFVKYKIEVPDDQNPKEVFRRALSEFGMKLTGDTGVESTNNKHHLMRQRSSSRSSGNESAA